MTVTMTAPRTRVDPGGMPSPPDSEVPEKAKRRRFSAEYKLAILREADACTEPARSARCCAASGGTPPTWSTGAASARLAHWRPWRVSVAPSLPTRPGSRWIGYVGRTSGCVAAWRRPSGSSRSREKSPSCWGSRSTRPATTSRARPDGRRRRGRARPWRHPGLPGAGDLPGDAVPAPAATGPTSVEQPATAAAAGPVRR
jgi:hypothetical protein